MDRNSPKSKCYLVEDIRELWHYLAEPHESGHFKAVEPSILIFDGPFPDITEPCARDERENRLTAAIGRVDINPIAAIPYCANSARCAAYPSYPHPQLSRKFPCRFSRI